MMTAKIFFTELQRLIFSFPKRPLAIINCEECEFCNEVYNSKNLFYCFDAYESSDSFYLFDSVQCANCGDCDYAVECELCYECVDPYKSFNCQYLEYCANMRDSAYCYRCDNCHDVFGCVELENKSFCFFNRQLTEQEYKEQVNKFKSLPSEKILMMLEDLKKRFPLTQTIGVNSVNCDYGNYIHYNKNCYLCFDAAHDDDCAYLYDSFYCKNSLDLAYVGLDTELAYQAVDSARLFNANYIVHSYNCSDSYYLFNCANVKNSLGCVGIKNKEFCILNRQFTSEQYQQLSGQILKDLAVANLGWDNIQY